MILWVLCAAQSALILALWGKICLLHRDLDDLCRDLEEKLPMDSNTLLSTASGDRHLKKACAALNRELRTLRGQRQRYRSGDQELKDAVSNISHDLRTPLTAIFGYLELLEREEKTPRAAECLAGIQNRAEAMNALTSELFDYSVAVSAREVKRERVDLRRLLEESLLGCYGAMEERGMTPEITLPGEAVWCMGDAAAISRVFANILHNALKYSDGDLAVTLRQEGEVTFSNGAPALDPVAVGRLFERFYTVETSRRSTGLGLSIARALTEKMGGKIRADYAEGRLTIRLSLERAA